MATTLSSLAAIQVERNAALPFKLAENPSRTLALEPLRRRNALLDAVFYDVGVIDDAESWSLSFWLAREGAILIVPPTGEGEVRVCLTTDEFFADDDGQVAALAVAGVGSSALGAAAFARNIADALDAPVAAVVSGYGLADVLTEALGGFFLFGALNSMRHAFETLDHVTKQASATARPVATLDSVTHFSEDTATVVKLLEDPRFSARLLVGHSKGNLVISEALYAIRARDEETARVLAGRLGIVTISAKIGMPAIFSKVIDVMGQFDGFGALNSRPDIPADVIVPRAWHSTNREFPFGMGIDVTKTLKGLMPTLAKKSASTQRLRYSGLPDLPQLVTAARVARAERHLVPAGGTPPARRRSRRRRSRTR